MFILFGTRTRTLFVAALIMACNRCGTPAAQRLFRQRTWFTLFFVPVFPFGHGRYTVQCAYCGGQSLVDRAAADTFAAQAEAFEQARLTQESLAPEPAQPPVVETP